ncbi:MAG: hypothetical protein LBQ31_07860 [Bacteroidales bacterium]|nr:hypothetical protein [Bacteroidales bacterium]
MAVAVIAVGMTGCSKDGDLNGTTWENGASVFGIFSGTRLEFSKTTVVMNAVAASIEIEAMSGNYTKDGNNVHVTWTDGEAGTTEEFVIDGKKMTSQESGTVYTKK